jgi:hypothetical protein
VRAVILESVGAEHDQAAEERKTRLGFDPAALDQWLGERRSMGELDELFRQMKRALMERALAGELTHHPLRQCTRVEHLAERSSQKAVAVILTIPPILPSCLLVAVQIHTKRKTTSGRRSVPRSFHKSTVNPVFI